MLKNQRSLKLIFASITIIVLLIGGIYQLNAFYNPREPNQGEVATNCDKEDAHNHQNHLHPGSIPQQGRFLDCVWPPQPKFITNIINFDNDVDLSRASDPLVISTLQNRSIKPLLGDRFVHIKTTAVEEKWESSGEQSQITFFSYSNNQTVRVVMDSVDIVSIETFAANNFQPPLRQIEVERAIEIATKYWLNNEVDHVNQLRAYSILTHPDDNSALYFPTRMVYVSFHPDDSSTPELLTWVDLSSEKVTRSVNELVRGKNE